MQIYFREGKNNPLIHPWLQSDVKAHAEQQPCISFCYRCALSANISLPVRKRDKPRWWNSQCKSQDYSQETYLHYKKFSRNSCKLIQTDIILWSLKYIIVVHFSKLPLENLGYFATSGCSLLPLSNKQKKLSVRPRTERNSCISSLQARREYASLNVSVHFSWTSFCNLLIYIKQ